MIIASSVRRRRIESDSESEVENDDNDENNTQEEECDTNWHIPLGSQVKNYAAQYNQKFQSDVY